MKNGYELLADLEQLVKDCIYVSNDKLPDEFRDNRTDCVSLGNLERMCNERDGLEKISDYELARQERAIRVDFYADDIANGREINYIMK